MKKKPVIAITMGDPLGIGPEILVKALKNKDIYQRCEPVAIGSKDPIEDALQFTSLSLSVHCIKEIKDFKGEWGTIHLLNLENFPKNELQYGRVSALAGEAAIDYIMTGIDLAQKGILHGVVTGPINKEAINKAGYPYAGHTEIFAEKTKTKDYAMMLAHGDFRVIHVSTHVSLREACQLVKKERVLRVIELADETMKSFQISTPNIGVAGLNPHAGEEGLFGKEEIEEIIPAIEEARKKGIKVEGPVPPDTIFCKAKGGLYHIGVAMYHDQGHIPFKMAGFHYHEKKKEWSSMSGVNATIGLPMIRTSVDHGVAFGKAGQGRANEESLLEAIFMAIDLCKNQKS